MTNLRLKTVFAVAALSALLISGCNSTPKAPVAGKTNADGSTTNADGSVTYPAGTKPPTVTVTRNADGSITNPDGSVTYPAGSKAALAESAPPASQPTTAPIGRSRESANTEAPPPAAAKVRRIPSGTRVAVSMSETISASHNNAGDSFSGVLAEPLTSADGATVYARGTRVSGTVAAAKGRGKFKGAGDLALELTAIGGQTVHTTEYEKTQAGKGKRTAGMVGGGAGLGAVIGGLAGGGKGALIGGLAGAGAGTAASAYTGNKDVVIPAETVVTFTLTAPLTR